MGCVPAGTRPPCGTGMPLPMHNGAAMTPAHATRAASSRNATARPEGPERRRGGLSTVPQDSDARPRMWQITQGSTTRPAQDVPWSPFRIGIGGWSRSRGIRSLSRTLRMGPTKPNAATTSRRCVDVAHRQPPLLREQVCAGTQHTRERPRDWVKVVLTKAGIRSPNGLFCSGAASVWVLERPRREACDHEPCACRDWVRSPRGSAVAQP